MLSFYLAIWFPLGWFLLKVKGNTRSSNWYFIFLSLHVLYILSCFYFKLFFCIFMTCLKSLYIFFFAQLHINDHLFVSCCIVFYFSKNKDLGENKSCKHWQNNAFWCHPESQFQDSFRYNKMRNFIELAFLNQQSGVRNQSPQNAKFDVVWWWI